jgi:hypothetical protein
MIALHTLNLFVGCICISILGLAAHSVVLKDRIEPLSTPNVRGTTTALLFWAGAGGIVDMLLFFCGLIFAPPVSRPCLEMCMI